MSQSTSVKALQDTMLSMTEHQIDPHVDHYFSDGVYSRVMTLEQGDTVVGKTHKTNHLSVLLEGTVIISSKYGTMQASAPYIIHAIKGDKRAVYAVTKAKYMTIHVTDETDLDKIELATVEDK